MASANEKQSVKKVEYFEVGISPCFLSKEGGSKIRRANEWSQYPAHLYAGANRKPYPDSEESQSHKSLRLIFTHISEHARLEIPMDLRDLRAFSPPRPASPLRGEGVGG